MFFIRDFKNSFAGPEDLLCASLTLVALCFSGFPVNAVSTDFKGAERDLKNSQALRLTSDFAETDSGLLSDFNSKDLSNRLSPAENGLNFTQKNAMRLSAVDAIEPLSFAEPQPGAAFAFSDEDKNVEASVKLEINPYTVYSSNRRDSVYKTEIYGEIRWNIFENISVYYEALFLGRAGSIQSAYKKEYRKEGFNFLESFLEYRSAPYFTFRFGALSQDFLNAPLLMSDRTFPALSQEVSFAFPFDVSGLFVFQQAVADNTGEEIRRTSQLVGTPYFFTASSFLKTKAAPRMFNSVFEENLTFFYFTKLPPAAAEKSRRYGNSIKGFGNDSGFIFDFYGFHNNISWKAPFKNQWMWEAGFDCLYNLGAEHTYNTGGRFYGSLYYDFFSLVELKLSAELFGSQSDSSVAFFNSWIYGHNNRQGGGFSLQGHFYQSKVTVGARYIYTHPIEARRTSLEGGHYFSVYFKTGYTSVLQKRFL